MSAAVVPGAKLLPKTTNGPEPAPLMVMPTSLSRMFACPFSGRRAAMRRSSFGRRLFTEAGREDARLSCFCLKVADAER